VPQTPLTELMYPQSQAAQGPVNGVSPHAPYRHARPARCSPELSQIHIALTAGLEALEAIATIRRLDQEIRKARRSPRAGKTT